MASPVRFSARGAATISEPKSVQQNQNAANVTELSNQATYWDPYDIWLNRVRRPREQSAAGTSKALAMPTQTERDQPARK